MKTVFYFQYEGDLYEIALCGYVIARITCYLSGSYRQDVQYDDLPEEIKDKILDKVQVALLQRGLDE